MNIKLNYKRHSTRPSLWWPSVRLQCLCRQQHIYPTLSKPYHVIHWILRLLPCHAYSCKKSKQIWFPFNAYSLKQKCPLEISTFYLQELYDNEYTDAYEEAVVVIKDEKEVASALQGVLKVNVVFAAGLTPICTRMTQNAQRNSLAAGKLPTSVMTNISKGGTPYFRNSQVHQFKMETTLSFSNVCIDEFHIMQLQVVIVFIRVVKIAVRSYHYVWIDVLKQCGPLETYFQQVLHHLIVLMLLLHLRVIRCQ